MALPWLLHRCPALGKGRRWRRKIEQLFRGPVLCRRRLRLGHVLAWVREQGASLSSPQIVYEELISKITQ